MKTIKKILSILFIVSLIFNTVNFAYAELVEDEIEEMEEIEETLGEVEEPEASQPENTPVSMNKLKYITTLDEVFDNSQDELSVVLSRLKKLGILKDNTSFDLDEPATRGEFAFVAANILSGGKNVEDKPIEYEFKDVTSENEYYNEIALLLNNNIVGGYDDGTYRPDEPISKNDALNVLLKVMGYRQMSDYMGGIYTGYLNIANKLGLANEAISDENGFLKKIGMINLVDRALDTQIAQITEITDKGAAYSSNGETVLSSFFNIVCVSGVVVANNYTSLYSKNDATAKENSIKIGDYLISFDESIDASKYLGLNCDVYCKKDDITSGISIEIIEKRNKRTQILAQDILKFDSSDFTVEYKINEDNSKIYKINKNINIIFNGVASSENITKEMFTPAVGELSFIDNNNDGKDDILFIDSFVTYVSKYNGYNNPDYIGDIQGIHEEIPIFRADSVNIFVDDTKAAIQDISTDLVLLVQADAVAYKNSVNGKKYMTVDSKNSKNYRIIASTAVVSGEIDSFKDDSEIIIDNHSVTMSNDYQNVKSIGTSPYAGTINVGRYVKIGIDAYSNGAYIDEDRPSAKYGYITHMRSEGAFGDVVQVRIFSQDDTFVEPYLADKVLVYKQWTTGALNEGTYFAKNLSVSEVYNLADFKENGKFKPQLIKFMLDSDGKLKHLYIAGDDTATNYRKVFPENVSKNIFSLTKDFKDINGTYNPIGGFDSFYGIKNTTIAFVVPSDVNVDEKYFDIPTKNPYVFGTKINDCKIYDIDRDLSVNAFVKTITITDFSNTGETIKDGETFHNLVITDVNSTWDSKKDEPIVKLTGYSGYTSNSATSNKFYTYTVTSSELLSNENTSRTSLSKVPVTDLMPGDFILFSVDDFDVINGFRLVWRKVADEDTAPQKGRYTLYGDKPLDSTTHNNIEAVGGEIAYSYNGTLYVDVGYSDGTYMKLTSGGVLIDMAKGYEITAIGSEDARVGDFVYWHRNTQYISNVVFVRR